MDDDNNNPSTVSIEAQIPPPPRPLSPLKDGWYRVTAAKPVVVDNSTAAARTVYFFFFVVVVVVTVACVGSLTDVVTVNGERSLIVGRDDDMIDWMNGIYTVYIRYCIENDTISIDSSSSKYIYCR